jgi:hypothetical protein
METDDALKTELRSLGVQLMSMIQAMSRPSKDDKNSNISHLRAHIESIISFIEIAGTIGFVSEMNAQILKKEFNLLSSELNKYQENRFGGMEVKPSPRVSLRDFSLDEKSLEVMLPVYEKPELLPVSDLWKNESSYQGQIKDTKGSQVIQNRYNRTLSGSRIAGTETGRKDERLDKIMSIIKDKKEVSIKDISNGFNNCSEKTIQRDLNNLVSLGKIKKIGDKRWSRYILL